MDPNQNDPNGQDPQVPGDDSVGGGQDAPATDSTPEPAPASETPSEGGMEVPPPPPAVEEPGAGDDQNSGGSSEPSGDAGAAA